MPDRLNANDSLTVGTPLWAGAGNFYLVYQGDGNAVVYDTAGNAQWATGTDGSSVGQLVMQGDGNLVIYDGGGGAVWSSDTEGNPGAFVVMQGDGNLVIYAADGHPLWASQDQDDDGGWFSSITGAIGDAVGAVVGAVQTVVDAAVDTVEGIVSPFFNLAGAIIGLIESIPIVGRAISWAINAVLDIVQRIINWLPELIFVWLGLMPEKRMRIMVLIQQTRGDSIADVGRVMQYVQTMINVYKDQCNVRVLPALPFHYSSPFQGTPTASDSYYSYLPGIASNSTLVVSCGNKGAEDDLGITSGSGPEFQAMMNLSTGFWGAGRRAITYGAPITTFAVKEFTDGHDGCSDAIATDWVLVHFKSVRQNLDGVSTATSTSTSQLDILVTTAQNNALVVLVVFAEHSKNPAPFVKTVSSSTGPWARRSLSRSSRHGSLEIWWSISAKPLSNERVTVTYDGDFERSSSVAFGVAGVSNAAPWDTSPSQPHNSIPFTSDLPPSFTQLSTVAPHNLLFCVVATNSPWKPASPPPGYTLLAGVENTAGSNAANLAVAYLVRTSPLVDETVSWGSSLPTGNSGAEAIFDAIPLATLLDDQALLLTMAHENGHACGLGHTDGTIMSPGYQGRTSTFDKSQILAIRVSRHVTYL